MRLLVRALAASTLVLTLSVLTAPHAIPSMEVHAGATPTDPAGTGTSGSATSPDASGVGDDGTIDGTTESDTPGPATDDPATGDPAPSDPDADAGTGDSPTTEPTTETGTENGTETGAGGLPPIAPPGFSEEQYRRFVDSVTACGLDPGRVCDWAYSLTGNAALAEALQWIVDVPLRVALVGLAAIAVNRVVRRWVLRHVERAQARRSTIDLDDADDPERFRRDALRAETLAGTIGGAATVAIFTIAALVALGEIGVTIGPLLAGAGIVGIALGFGAQHLVRDVLAGLFVIMEDQYGVGDIIDVGRTSGTVEAISLRITKIRDVHGTLWFVPNGVVSEVGNLTQLWARAIIDFDIDYRADHERAGEIIKETADRIWREPASEVRILEEPALWGVESLADSSVVIRIAVKTAPAEQWKVARLLRGEVKKALDAEGIEIPFPQHTVWIHGEPAAT